MPPPPPPSLPDDLLEEIFLRFPPDEPACLVRASLSSKFWLGVLSGPRFRGRYHEHHEAPPMLGFLRAWPAGYDPDGKGPVPRFTSTAKFGARIPDDEWDDFDYSAWDCRHGRVLLGDTHNTALLVWDPMTGCRRGLDWPNLLDDSHGFAVLCAVSGCRHRTCHAAPYQVVFVGMEMNVDVDDDCVAFACVSLPETGDWSKPCPPSDQWGKQCPHLHLPMDAFIQPMPPVLIQEAVHFMIRYLHDDSQGIIMFDLSSNSLSLIAAPIKDSEIGTSSIIMAMEDGSLGYAHVNGSTLYLWSRLMDSNRVDSWSKRTIINLGNLLPIQNPVEKIRLVGSVEGGDVVFVTTVLGIYEINVESQRWKKLWKRINFDALIPYMSFYNRQERVMLAPGDAAHRQGMAEYA
ncbi:uncharacterized protein LOC123399554 [Hordeum vulgare subsp. vulgare]|uniref:F-box domain-containing protein n=1 Tax=Hordeum vulgare subsp. vulgare TaxID=112509 RepID=A0A8I6XNK5_HORVV|nr:uncharacterized protein LOC123399554 [Hordeum vulgare subsp. vulgare]